MKYIVFDTETTGLPKDYKASAKDVDNWPRIIQLAWVIYDEEENILKERKELIKPNGWIVPKEKFWIEHGYSTEDCEVKGVVLGPLVQELIEDMNGCDLLISHNMQYDSKVLGAEMYRMQMDTASRIKKFCTKEAGTDFCELTQRCTVVSSGQS